MARLTATLAVAAALLMAVGVAGAGAAAAACAPGCSCNGGGMSCAELGLTALPEGAWPSVTLLNVSGNALSSLGALGERFPALRVLLARDNRVAELPLDAVAGPRAPPRLVAVDLSRNAIRRVLPPAEAASGGGSLNDLALLYLGGNRLATLDPEVFSRLPRLQHLSLNDNPLVVPAGRPLLVHPRLAALDLRRVDARALSSTTLAALPALEEVALESSRVRSIGGVFAHLPLLDSVYLQSNEITEIPVDSFSKDAHLSHLSLDFNPLQSVDPAALPVRDRGELHIRDTPLACSCAHEQVARWAAEHRIKLLASCSEAPVCPFANVVMP